MRKNKAIIIATVLISTLTGCQSKKEPTVEELNVTSLVQMLDEKHKSDVEVVTTYDTSVITDRKVNPDVQFSEEELNVLFEPRSIEPIVTKEEAVADTETLMRLLESSYGGYDYFGGKERFDQAKEAIINRVKENDKTTIFLNDFQRILNEELSFVEDNHLFIGDNSSRFNEEYLFYESSMLEFQKTSEGYTTIIDENRFYLDAEFDHMIMPTVDEEGNLTYGIFQKSENEENLPTQITLHNGKNEKIYDVEWKKTEAGIAEDAKDYIHTSYEIDGIKVTTLRAMWPEEKAIKETNDFINEAKGLKDEDVFIIDLRGNQGGLSFYSTCFFYNLRDELIKCGYPTVTRYSTCNIEQIKRSDELLTNISFDFDIKNEQREFFDELTANLLIDADSLEVDSVRITDNTRKWHESNQTIIALVDKDIVSAGELFLYELLSMEHVILVGTNSSGTLTCGDVGFPIYLPNTNLRIIYPSTLFLNPSIDGFEKSGIIPDVVSKTDALEDAIAIAKMIKEKK